MRDPCRPAALAWGATPPVGRGPSRAPLLCHPIRGRHRHRGVAGRRSRARLGPPGQLDHFFNSDGQADGVHRTAPPATRSPSTTAAAILVAGYTLSPADGHRAGAVPAQRQARPASCRRRAVGSHESGRHRLRVRRRHPDGRQDRRGRRARPARTTASSRSCATASEACSTSPSAAATARRFIDFGTPLPGRQRRGGRRRAGRSSWGASHRTARRAGGPWRGYLPERDARRRTSASGGKVLTDVSPTDEQIEDLAGSPGGDDRAAGYRGDLPDAQVRGGQYRIERHTGHTFGNGARTSIDVSRGQRHRLRARAPARRQVHPGRLRRSHGGRGRLGHRPVRRARACSTRASATAGRSSPRSAPLTTTPTAWRSSRTGRSWWWAAPATRRGPDFGVVRYKRRRRPRPHVRRRRQGASPTSSGATTPPGGRAPDPMARSWWRARLQERATASPDRGGPIPAQVIRS